MLSHNTTDDATLSFILAALDTGQEALHAQGVEAQTLVGIYNDFIRRSAELEEIAAFAAKTLMQAGEVHLVRHRVKDPVHLLRKIIRKKQEYPDRTINQHNYLQWINDLAGIRVLHLYKESWISIGQYIQEVWELKRPPIAYLRDDETEQNIQLFLQHGCEIKKRNLGYRAVHFVIATQPGRQKYFAEIQLRTLFEEGWSEIDHTIRYPDHVCSELLKDLLSILNRLTGNADDMASFINALSHAFEHEVPLQAHQAKFARIRSQVDELPITEKEKQVLRAHINRLLEKGRNS